MERASKILTILFFVGLAYIVYSVFWSKLDTYFAEDPIPMEKIAEQKPEFGQVVTSGPSMEPTIMSGTSLRYSTRLTPKSGDVIVFKCNKQLCVSNKENETKTAYSAKRVSAILGDCYTVLGDNPSKSFDSRNYGDLCGSDIEILGVVVSPDTTKRIEAKPVTTRSQSNKESPEKSEKYQHVSVSDYKLKSDIEYLSNRETPDVKSPEFVSQTIETPKRLETKDFNYRLQPMKTSTGKPTNGSECSSSAAPHLPYCN